MIFEVCGQQVAYTENGALSNKTTGDDPWLTNLVKQVIIEVEYWSFKDQYELWNEDSEKALVSHFIFVSCMEQIRNENVTEWNYKGIQGARDVNHSQASTSGLQLIQPDVFIKIFGCCQLSALGKDIWGRFYIMM